MSATIAVCASFQSPAATRSITNEARKSAVSTSASVSVPPTDQCTFSNVTEKTVARKRKRVTTRRP